MLSWLGIRSPRVPPIKRSTPPRHVVFRPLLAARPPPRQRRARTKSLRLSSTEQAGALLRRSHPSAPYTTARACSGERRIDDHFRRPHCSSAFLHLAPIANQPSPILAIAAMAAANGMLTPPSLPPAPASPSAAKRKVINGHPSVPVGASVTAQSSGAHSTSYSLQLVLKDILSVLKRYAQ